MAGDENGAKKKEEEKEEKEEKENGADKEGMEDKKMISVRVRVVPGAVEATELNQQQEEQYRKHVLFSKDPKDEKGVAGELAPAQASFASFLSRPPLTMLLLLPLPLPPFLSSSLPLSPSLSLSPSLPLSLSLSHTHSLSLSHALNHTPTRVRW